MLLPYIAISWSKIYDTGFYSFSNFVLILLTVVLLDLLLYLFFWKLFRIALPLHVFLINIFLLFFYADMFVPNSVSLLNIFFVDYNIRYRWVFLFYFILFYLIHFCLLRFKRYPYKFFNSFSIILFIVVSVWNISKADNRGIGYIKNISSNKIHFKTTEKSSKPIILIITDEYSSPDQIFNITKDSNTYDFSKNLSSSGWIVKNNFYSHEQSTINSISSLFNFNLSKDGTYSKESIIDIAINKLYKNSFYESLNAKNGKIINYGIFHIGDSKPLTKLFSYPENFIEQFLLGSTLFSINLKKGVLSNSGNINEDYPFERHNKKVLYNLGNLDEEGKVFIYAHLFLPHNPFVFQPEYKFRNLSLDNYISFWNFSNTKIHVMLNRLVKEDKYRIIITGDHGYRADKNIDFHSTFGAFYGFEKGDVDKIVTVQDVGSLIDSYFQN